LSQAPLVIVGGVAGGLAAAMEARRRAPALDIIVLEQTGDVSYGACGLPYVISGVIPTLARLVVHEPEYFHAQHRIELQLNTEALALYPAKSVVRVRQDGTEREFGFSNLVLATGAAAICPPLPGHDLAGVFVLRHMQQGRQMLSFLNERRPRAAAIVGAGYIGLELAEAFVRRGLHTTIIESSDKVMSTLEGSLRDRVVEELRAHGVEVIFGERAVAFEGGAQIKRVLTDQGRAVEAQIVCIGVGVRANAALAAEAGLEIGASGAIVVDAEQRTSAPNVYAAGDCCEVLHRVSGARVWLPLGQPAVRQGWIAGANAAGAQPAERYAGVVGTNVVKVFDLEVARTGLSLREAQAAGFNVSASEDETPSRAGYYPGGARIRSRIIYDNRGRLLGAQMVGPEGVAQRIDVYAAALHAGLKIEEINNFDLAYAPPFAPTIDPILRTTKKGMKDEGE
jgi:NADPH-dependent 2,4-dienoyl-CoA reductase/sulfur reductase-like enzyme